MRKGQQMSRWLRPLYRIAFLHRTPEGFLRKSLLFLPGEPSEQGKSSVSASILLGSEMGQASHTRGLPLAAPSGLSLQ